MLMDAVGDLLFQEGCVFVFYPQAGGEVCIVYDCQGRVVSGELVA